ncbi:MAG: hypothetical protein WA874_14065 [Chryseosolibacter sp.]
MESALKNKPRLWPFQSSGPLPVTRNISVLVPLRRLWYRLTHWETWDWRIKYILIGPAWIWYCLRARSLWFFTASNPTLTFGGFDGESKKEMYAQLPPGSYPKSIYVSPDLSFQELENLLQDRQYEFPFAVKPDVGKMGFMFRRINSPAQLKAYHGGIQCEYIIQELVKHPIEVSVFYYRFPHAQKGTITGFIRKDFLEVTGDGRSTLWQLMLACPRLQFRLEEMKAKHTGKLDQILCENEKYCLSPALNLSRGGRLVSLEKEKDDRLLKIFDDLSHYAGNFYYGRYDIKCESIEALKEGNFSILEYNGSGAEPHHVYGNGYNLWQACKILVAHWHVLYHISKINRANGTLYWDFRRGREFLQQTATHLKKLRQLDLQTPLT